MHAGYNWFSILYPICCCRIITWISPVFHGGNYMLSKRKSLQFLFVLYSSIVFNCENDILQGCFLILESYLQYFHNLSQKSDQEHIIHLLIEAIGIPFVPSYICCEVHYWVDSWVSLLLVNFSVLCRHVLGWDRNAYFWDGAVHHVCGIKDYERRCSIASKVELVWALPFKGIQLFFYICLCQLYLYICHHLEACYMIFSMFFQTLPAWVEMKSVSQAKSKIGHAVMMILQVGVLEKFKSIPTVTSLDLACFAGAVFVSSACIFLLSRLSAGGS